MFNVFFKSTILSTLLLSIGNFSFAEEIKVVERVQTSTGGYTKWSDGFIEQWGRKNAGESAVIFYVPFTDVNSISFVIQEYARSDQYGRQPLELPTVTGVHGFNRIDLSGTWTAKGF